MKVLSLLLVVLIGVAGLWTSTAYVAYRAGYPHAFGAPWFTVQSVPIYAPWAWLGWNLRYGSRAPDLFRWASGITTIAALVGALLATVFAARRKSAAPSHAHGSSRWATSKELRRAGLLGEAGVILCQTSDARFATKVTPRGAHSIIATRLGQLVRHDGPEHVFCFAPTRSGKGIGLVIPTLLTWPHSTIVYDIKKENWCATAGWRRKFSHVWRFEPTAIDSVRFNPLLEVRKGVSEVKDTQNIADILVDPTGEKESRDHWQTTAHSLLVGAVLHVLYAEVDKTLSGVAQFLSDPARSQVETLHRMMVTPHLPTGPHPAVAQAAREMLNKSDNELSGVFSTAMACLGLYRDPVVARNTSDSDFRIADLMNAASPVSLYLVVPPSDLARTRPIIRLLLNQIGRRLTESLPFEGQRGYQHRLLLLLDEFPSLGRLDFFETSLAFIAAYGLKAVLIAQSLNQLEKAYGQNNSILDNCHVRLTYAANDDRTAKRISDLLGQSTEKKLQRSYSGSGWFLTSRTESEQEYPRPLLTAAEVNQLPQDDGLLLVGGLLPYRSRKVRYFLDPRFDGRANLTAPNTPAEQAAELLQRTANDWEELTAAPSEEELSRLRGRSVREPPSAPPGSSLSANGAVAEVLSGSDGLDQQESTSRWAGFFEASTATSTPESSTPDEPSVSVNKEGELPL